MNDEAGRPATDRPAAAGAYVPAEWRATLRAVPRSWFLPDLCWSHEIARGTSVPLRRADDADAWRAAAEADVPIVTQWDDGRHTGTEPGTVPTSSISMPSVVATMLDTLALDDGMRVLEIGTGTGWNAALLATRLGDRNVTTVEVDPRVAEDARQTLRRAGRNPRVVTGDGLAGCPDGAPYDRIVATAGLRHVPAAWLAQLRPGGLIVAPFGTHYGNGDGLVRLTLLADGTASGPFVQPVEFMKVRSQRPTWPSFRDGPDLPVVDHTTETPLPPHTPRWHPFPFAAGLRLPDVTHAVQPHRDGHTLWLYARDGSAWASATRRTREARTVDGPGAGAEGGAGDARSCGRPGRTTGRRVAAPVTRVRQVGHRRLWEELAAVHDWWIEQGEPGHDRFGLTVHPDSRARAWLDTSRRGWPLPPAAPGD